MAPIYTKFEGERAPKKRFLIFWSKLSKKAGADLGFSRRGGGGMGSKNFKHFVDQIDLPSSPKALQRLCFGQKLSAAFKILKKQAKKGIFRHFLKNFDQKNRVFSVRAPPLKYYILAPKAPLEKF